MSKEPRFLLGFGERLTSDTERPPGGHTSDAPYGFEEAIERMSSQLDSAVQSVQELPDAACPNNETVLNITLHPQSLAKSYHPKPLLDQYNLRQVGSKPTEITPEKWTKKPDPEKSPATTLFIAGDRESFEKFRLDVKNSPERLPGDHIQRIELIEAPEPQERIRRPNEAVKKDDTRFFEVLLHARPESSDRSIVEAFSQFADYLGIEALIDKRIFAGGLCFIPVRCQTESLDRLAEFSFLRSARPASRLRGLTPGTGFDVRDLPSSSGESPTPSESTEVNVAILDGGLQNDPLLQSWATSVVPNGLGTEHPQLVSHGTDVLSAFLFGNISPDSPLDTPPAKVDCWRVLDIGSEENPFDLYDALQHISAALHSGKYQFLNLSVGPSMCIDDEDIHPWTAVIDEALADGQILATIAAGNNGDLPDNRVQVPSDCINALTVGAADSDSEEWNRADYSAVGPGRSPGLIKPDLLAFGGSESKPFYVTNSPSKSQQLKPQQGTSFAAPLALRQAVSIRKHFGEQLKPLSLKALLVHSSTPGPSSEHAGWGRMNHDIADIVMCDENEVRVVYQGTLEPAKYLRAGIPLPDGLDSGLVHISATFCYASEVDPEDPGNYSRSGLDITFRPHSQVFKNDEAIHPKSDPFFQNKDFATEAELRKDAHKWETVLHKTKSKRAASLHNPAFDIHYNARSNGGSAKTPRSIPYSLVVSVRASQSTDLYDKVVRQFGGTLQPLLPVLQLPVQT